MALLVAVAGGLWAWRRIQEPRRAWRALLALEGRDLRRQALDDVVDTQVAWRRFGGSRDLHNQAFQPLGVFRLDPGGPRERVLLLEASEEADQHTVTGLRLHVLDREGGLLTSTELDAGPRVQVWDAAVENSLLRVRSLSLFASRIGAFVQHYGLHDDQPLLVRLESDKGVLRRNRYRNARFCFGPRPPRRTPSEWTGELGSGDRLRCLAALTWLAGDHDPPPDDFGPLPLAPAEPPTADEVRAHPEVARHIQTLRSSPDPWVREAAAVVPLP